MTIQKPEQNGLYTGKKVECLTENRSEFNGEMQYSEKKSNDGLDFLEGGWQDKDHFKGKALRRLLTGKET